MVAVGDAERAAITLFPRLFPLVFPPSAVKAATAAVFASVFGAVFYRSSTIDDKNPNTDHRHRADQQEEGLGGSDPGLGGQRPPSVRAAEPAPRSLPPRRLLISIGHTIVGSCSITHVRKGPQFRAVACVCDHRQRTHTGRRADSRFERTRAQHARRPRCSQLIRGAGRWPDSHVCQPRLRHRELCPSPARGRQGRCALRGASCVGILDGRAAAGGVALMVEGEDRNAVGLPRVRGRGRDVRRTCRTGDSRSSGTHAAAGTPV